MSQKAFAEGLLEAYRAKEKKRLFEEARTSSAKVPLLQINGALMNPKEALQYLKLRMESYLKAKKKEKDLQLVCPTCGSVPLSS